jgi:hypothetical protein
MVQCTCPFRDWPECVNPNWPQVDGLIWPHLMTPHGTEPLDEMLRGVAQTEQS